MKAGLNWTSIITLVPGPWPNDSLEMIRNLHSCNGVQMPEAPESTTRYCKFLIPRSMKVEFDKPILKIALRDSCLLMLL